LPPVIIDIVNKPVSFFFHVIPRYFGERRSVFNALDIFDRQESPCSTRFENYTRSFLNMSNEAIADPVLKSSKKDKKSKKSKSEDVTMTPVAEGESSKKEKKDKKRKREGEAELEGPKPAEGEKKKKSKKEKVTEGEAVAAPAPVVEEGEKRKSKKEKKDKKNKETAEVAQTSSATGNAGLAGALASTADSSAFLKKHNITLTPEIYNILLSFSTLPINPALRPYLVSYKVPTPIQACSWPPLFEGKDVVGIAETGSGKTLSFGLPGLNLLSTTSSPINAKGKGRDAGKIRLLVVAPTRELATQTYVVLLALGKLVGVGAVCLYGGVGKQEQIAELRKKETAIVVGTPGRVMDLADSGDVDFSG
jgi:ATP-dependent RNA helicase DBP3